MHQRIKYVALSLFFDALDDTELAVDVMISMQDVLIDYQRWLKKHDDETGNRVLLKHLEHYWREGKWPVMVTIKAMPPGSPI